MKHKDWKCNYCGSQKNLCFEPMYNYGFGEPKDYVICAECVEREYDDGTWLD